MYGVNTWRVGVSYIELEGSRDFKGQLGVPLRVYPWYLAGVL